MNQHKPLELPQSLVGQTITLPEQGSWPETPHVFDKKSIWAVNAALASGRPLLIRGEPGTGKSQLARAAAHQLQWPFLSTVINARFEPEDLLYRFDAVARLSKAQILPKNTTAEEAEERLAAKNFLLPEILWWAFDHQSASDQYNRACGHCGDTGSHRAEKTPIPKTEANGFVVLIDEIDKADSEVPNSLLEALGNGGFEVPYHHEPVVHHDNWPPLVIITTNEDRELPPAFLRRCLVLHMDLPHESKQRSQLEAILKIRAEAHYPKSRIPKRICEEAIKLLIEDRTKARDRDLPLPGQAELLDVLSVLQWMDQDKQQEALEEVKGFAFEKNRDES